MRERILCLHTHRCTRVCTYPHGERRTRAYLRAHTQIRAGRRTAKTAPPHDKWARAAPPSVPPSRTRRSPAEANHPRTGLCALAASLPRSGPVFGARFDGHTGCIKEDRLCHHLTSSTQTEREKGRRTTRGSATRAGLQPSSPLTNSEIGFETRLLLS